MQTDIEQLRRHAAEGAGIPESLAMKLLVPLMFDLQQRKRENTSVRAMAMEACFHAAESLRKRYFGNRVELCAIINAKSGDCSEDCTFCAQSCRSRHSAPVFPLASAETIHAARSRLDCFPVQYFSVVASGKRLEEREIAAIADTMRQADGRPPRWCASLGCLEKASLARLQEAGMVRYHHNLEVAESFFPEVCSSHTYRERVETIRRAKALGLQVCSGGIFGVGESPEHRVELAYALAREKVDSIPLNFLIPVPGTPLEHAIPLSPEEILLIVALFRLACPRANLRIAGGRGHLGSWQSRLFRAGADGMMVGDLLTVGGKEIEEDLRWLTECGLNAHDVS